MHAHRWLTIAGLVSLVTSCTSERSASGTDGPPPDLLRSAARFYDAYGKDLREHRRERLAQYYAPEGALFVIAGRRMQVSRPGIDSLYKGWEGPAYFAWDSLRFDSLSPSLVLVTGGFDWQVRGSRDTARFIYASILQAIDSGLAIRFEHETPKPNSKR